MQRQLAPHPTHETSPQSIASEFDPDLPVPAPLTPSPLRTPQAAPPQSKSLVGQIVFWIVLLAFAYAAWHFRATWYPHLQRLLPAPPPPLAKSGSRTIPVATTVVGQRDLNVYLNGLGTVTAYQTVTLKSRVEGELVNVAFEEGQMVKAGDLLAEIDPRPFLVQVAQAEGQLARDEATLKGAQLTLDRYKSLLSSNTVTGQQVDEQEAIVKQFEGTLKTDAGLLENARLQLTYCRIVAPIDGRIGLRLVDKGNIIRANDSTGLAVITQLQPIAVVFPIPQDEIIRVQKRMQTETSVEVQAYDRTMKNLLAVGKLEAIDNQVDPTTGTLKMKAVFDNSDAALFPNQFVNARLLVDTLQNAVIVPTSSLQRGPESSYVYVLKPDETVELRTVELGPAEAAETSIRSGLFAGEVIVTDGLDKLQPGAKVVDRSKKENAPPSDRTAQKPPFPSDEHKGSK